MRGIVQVAAVGARTPVGLTAESTAAAVRADISRIAMHPFMIDNNGEPVRGAWDGMLEPNVMGWQRLAQLAESPLGEVVTKLSKSGAKHPGPIDVLLGVPETRPGWSEQDNAELIRAISRVEAPGLGGLQARVVAAGHAGALYAIGAATHQIAQGKCELCIAGGVDSYTNADTIDWLQDNRQLVAKDVRSGFFPGEAAGFVALGSPRILQRLELEPLARVRGAHHAEETNRIKTDAVNLGEGLTRAVEGAARTLRLPDEAVDAIFCDINGERYRSEEWAFVALRLPHVCRDATQYEGPTDCWGDLGAASGALFAVLAMQSWQRGYARGPRALLCAGSEGGLRAAVVLEQEPPRD